MDCVDAVSRTEAAGCCCWLLTLIAAAGCCCWLLLLVAAVDCCCWLLLLIAAADCCCWLLLLIAAADCCCWLLLLVIAAQKVFEYFRNIVVDLRLRQICRRKSLWIFSGVNEKFLNNCGLLVKSLWIFSGCWWKSLNIPRILMGEKWKRGSPRGSRLESEWRLWLCAGYLYSIFQDGRRLSESQ